MSQKKGGHAGGNMSGVGAKQGLSAQEVSQFDQAFRAMDKKKAGIIPTKSLRTILESMGHTLTNTEFYIITADADVESSGTLDFQEYMSCCVAFKQNNIRTGPRITKEAYDSLVAGDEGLDPDVVKAALVSFGLELNVDKVMDERGIKLEDGKGGLTSQQFSDLLR